MYIIGRSGDRFCISAVALLVAHINGVKVTFPVGKIFSFSKLKGPLEFIHTEDHLLKYGVNF